MADDETNPIEWNLAVGVGGTGVFDLQYIDSAFGNGPLASETRADAWIGGLRLRIVL